jgi:hypothetical protein
MQRSFSRLKREDPACSILESVNHKIAMRNRLYAAAVMKPALNHVKYVRFFSNGLESSKSCL